MKRWTIILAAFFGLSWGLVCAGADFNGDGTNDIGIFRESSGLWAIRNVTRVYFGMTNDQPMPGDYDGDGVVDIGVFRPSSSLWAIKDISRLYFGNSSDEPLIGIPAGGAWRVSGGNIYRSAGYVGIGTSSPGAALEVEADELNYVAIFQNTHDTVNSRGILIEAGSSLSGGEGDMIAFQNGAGAYVGAIENNFGTISISPFTASHLASVPIDHEKEGYPYGTVMTLSKAYPDAERPHQASYQVKPSRKACDKAVFGVYAGKKSWPANLHTIFALGDGHILVTKEGGDIEIGDYLTTSSREGQAMRQDDDLLHSYTVAKAQEPVCWENEESDSKLIACTYHAQ